MNEKEAEAYADGVREAVEYLADLFEGVYDTDVFEVHGVTRIKETM